MLLLSTVVSVHFLMMFYITDYSTTDLLFLFQLLQDISKWDVSKVITLEAAFKFATLFNGGKCPFCNDVLILFTKKAQLICCFSFNCKIFPNGVRGE